MTSHPRLKGPRDHLSARLEAVVSRAQDNVAIVAGDTIVTFGELARRVASFSAELADAGVQPRDRVAVVLPNGLEFVVAAFAVWKRGAILVPLHLQFREREILRYITDCSAHAIVTTEEMSRVVDAVMQETHGSVAHAWLCPKDGGTWVHRKSPSGQRATGAPPADDQALGADWPALTQFSTGSSGHPKRITRSHGHLIGEFEAVSEVLGRTEADRVLGVAPFYHSYGIMNGVVGPVLGGSRLYTVEKFFPRDVAQLVERERITGFPGGPFMFQLLAEMRERATFSSVRYAVSAGAPLPDSVVAAFKAKYGITVRELYGCTEAGVVCIEPEDQDRSREHSVGLPIPGVTVRIIDADGRPVPAGAKGRVEVISPYAAARYDQSEEQTDAHFVELALLPGRSRPSDAGRRPARAPRTGSRLHQRRRQQGRSHRGGNRAARDACCRRGRRHGPSRRRVG